MALNVVLTVLAKKVKLRASGRLNDGETISTMSVEILNRSIADAWKCQQGQNETTQTRPKASSAMQAFHIPNPKFQKHIAKLDGL